VAVNKWDAVDSYQREMLMRSIEHRLSFLKFAQVLHIFGDQAPGPGPAVEGDWRCLVVGHPQNAHASADPSAG